MTQLCKQEGKIICGEEMVWFSIRGSRDFHNEWFHLSSLNCLLTKYLRMFYMLSTILDQWTKQTKTSFFMVLHPKRMWWIKDLYISNAEWLSKGENAGIHQQKKVVLS